MDLMKITDGIPNIVYEWAEQHAKNTCYSFVSVLSHRYGEIVERTFGVRKYAKKGVLITEVRRRATGNNSNQVIKNLLVSSYNVYIPVFERQDRYSYNGGYPFKVFDKSEFDEWYIADKSCGFHTVCLNKEILAEIDEFKYCGYSCGDVIEYLNEYRKNPLIEFFGKLNLPISPSLISLAKKDKQFRTFLGKHASDVRLYGPRATVYAFNHNETISAAAEKLHKKRMLLKEIPVLKEHDVDYERIFEYCKTNKIAHQLYKDYLEAVIGIGLDLKDTKNIYPKDFNAMHDLRITEYESQMASADRVNRRELYESFAKAGEKATAYEFSGNGYAIISPKDISDLAIEGKILGHCVGKMGYDKKMADGKVVIMFLRKTTDLKKPFVTIEYDLAKSKLLQAYGKNNTTPPEEVMIFINKWLVAMKKLRKKIA